MIIERYDLDNDSADRIADDVKAQLESTLPDGWKLNVILRPSDSAGLTLLVQAWETGAKGDSYERLIRFDREQSDRIVADGVSDEWIDVFRHGLVPAADGN